MPFKNEFLKVLPLNVGNRRKFCKLQSFENHMSGGHLSAIIMLIVWKVITEIMRGCAVGCSSVSVSSNVELFCLKQDSCMWKCSKNKTASCLQL